MVWKRRRGVPTTPSGATRLPFREGACGRGGCLVDTRGGGHGSGRVPSLLWLEQEGGREELPYGVAPLVFFLPCSPVRLVGWAVTRLLCPWSGGA